MHGIYLNTLFLYIVSKRENLIAAARSVVTNVYYS